MAKIWGNKIFTITPDVQTKSTLQNLQDTYTIENNFPLKIEDRIVQVSLSFCHVEKLRNIH